MNSLTRLELLHARCEQHGNACRLDQMSRCAKCHCLVCDECSKRQDSGKGRVCKKCEE